MAWESTQNCPSVGIQYQTSLADLKKNLELYMLEGVIPRKRVSSSKALEDIKGR